MTIRTRALFLMGLIVAVSCSDSGNPLSSGGEEPQPLPPASVVALDCTVSIAGGGMQCALPQPGSGAASASGELIVGGQNVYVRLAASNFSTPADSIQFDVTVENLIPQALGTTDGVSTHPDGVRVFFDEGPVSNNPSAAASVGNPDGTAFFTTAAQPYFQWNEMLAPNQTSAPRTWKIQYTPGSTSVSFRVYVWAQVQYENGWIDVTPPADTLEQGGSVTLGATARDRIGRTGTVSQSFTWSRGGDGVTTVDASTGEVTALSASGVDTIYVTNGTQTGRAVIVVENAPVFQQDTIAAVSNLTVGRPAPRLASRITDTESNASVVPGTYTSVEGGVARVYADGSYDYLSPAGFTGPDSFEFDISDGVHTIKGSVIVNVAASTYWYVQAGGTGDGRDRFPFGSIAAAQDSAAAGDSILVLSAGATALEGPAVLKDAQALIGQGIPASITRTLNDTTITVLAAGDAPGLSRTDAGPAVTLGAGNIIRGLGITASGGAGITGVGFGTLTTSQLGVSAAGPALHLTTGTLGADFDVLSSTNSATQGLFLSGVGGALTATGGAISGATGTAIDIVGGDATITYPGNVTNSAGRSVSVTGRTGGAVTLSGDIADTGTGILASGNTGGTIAFSGTSKSLSTGAAAAVTLTSNAGVSIFFSGGGTDLSTTTGAALTASGGGTLEVTGAGNDVTTTTGAALALNGVEVGAGGIAFATVGTGAAAAPVSLVDVTSTGAIAVSGGTIAAGAGVRFAVSGGDVDVTWAGALQQSGNAASLVSVAGSHAGSLTFSGGLTATSGDGLQFNAADGTYAFSGTTGLNGGDAGVDITNGSTGSFTFGTGTSITSPSGTAFNVYGSSPTVVYSGGIAKGNAGAMIEVGEQPGGSVTFQTGTLSASAGSGISLSNADGTVAFNGTTTLSGGPAIAVVGGSAGTISFASGASVTNPASAGLLVSASAPTLTYAGSISSNAARPVQIEGMTGGSVAVSGSVSGTGNGILVQNNNTGSAKTITFSGAVTLSTGANEAVTLANNAGATIGFTGGATDLTTTTGNAFAATGGGTVNLSGGSNDIATSTGSALLLNGVTFGASGMSLATLNVTGAAVAPVVITNVGVTTGSSLTVSGGSIAAGAGTRVAVSGGTVNVTWAGNVSQSTHNASLLSVAGGHTTGTLAFSGTLAASSGNGLQFNNAAGTYNFTGTTTLNGGDAGVDITNVSNGSFSFGTGTSITGPSGTAFDVNGGAPTITFAGPITHNSGRAVSLASMGGSATFSGNIAGSGASATGISVTSSSANVTFSGGSKSLSTQGNAAVTLTNNSGTVSFTNGGLAISTTSGSGLNASGGAGTLVVSGTNNTVTTTGGGRTLNIQNVNIGAADVTFRSITGTGASSGVRVENTGTAGGLKVTGDGSTASSGGIFTLNSVTAADSAAYTLTNTAHASLEFVRVNVSTGGGAAGVAAINLQGTNVVRNSVFNYNGVAPDPVPLHNAHALYFRQVSTNATITVDGSSVNGTRAGSSAGVLSAQGNSVVTFNVIDSNTGDGFQSLFTDLFGSGWVIGAGDNAGSTAVVNLTVRDSRFTNAAANGTNNLEMSAFENATLNYKIKDNLFQNVANASAIAGIINVNTLHSGRFGSTTAMDSIVGNTITNSGTASTVANLGYVGIRVALENNVTGIQHRLVIANNTITDLWRQGMLLSARGQNNGFNVRVENNTVGTAALPVGQSNRRGIEVEMQASAQMNIEVLNNSVYGAGTVDAAAALGLRTGIEAGTATMNATVVGNTLRSTSAGTSGRFRAETAGTGTGVMCLDLRTNNLEDASKTYALPHTAGTFRVEGAGTGAVTNASIQAANTTGVGNVSGTVLYNNGANCPQPAGL